MKAWDNLKSRLGVGNGKDYDEEYDDYDEYDEFNNEHSAPYPSSFTSDLDQENASTPLVSMYDIRSQRLQAPDSVAARRAASTQASVHPRSESRAMNLDDPTELRVNLAHGANNSLINLHKERLNYDAVSAIPEFTLPQGSSSRNASAATTAPLLSESYRGRGVNIAAPRGKRQIVRMSPQNYGEIESVAPTLRNGDIVVLDLTAVRPELAKRLLDFSFGVTSAFEGNVDRHGDRVYVLTTRSPLTEVEKAQI
ncbi:MAG: cell division protein SepF [Coriobacteriales bacterium]|jgi:cell division inhibitor SepF|nr:cell division protein SepF [Coriobacteriales bacterium]